MGSCSLTSVRTPTRPREAERNRTPRCVPMNRPPVRLLSRLLVNSCAFSSLSRSSQLNLKHSAIGGGGDGALAPVAYCQKWRWSQLSLSLQCRTSSPPVRSAPFRHPPTLLLLCGGRASIRQALGQYAADREAQGKEATVRTPARGVRDRLTYADAKSMYATPSTS